MENENVKGERREPEENEFWDGEFCAACGKFIWLDAYILFSYSAVAFIYDRTQGKVLDVDVAQPKATGGGLMFCHECAAGSKNPFINTELFRGIVEAAKTFEKESTPSKKSLWQKARGMAARLLPN